MRKLFSEFKNFAFGGNLVDLAIGFIIGGAFAGVVQSLAKNVIGDFIAAAFGQPDLSGVEIHLRKGTIHIGSFLGDLMSFTILAFVMLLLVKAFAKLRLGNFRAQGRRECTRCKEFVPVDATRCKFCTSDLVPLINNP